MSDENPIESEAAAVNEPAETPSEVEKTENAEKAEAAESAEAPETETAAPTETEPVVEEAPKAAAKGFRLPEKIGAIDHLIGIGLGAIYVVWLLATSRSLGFARDEGFYFRAGSDYARWFELLFKSPAKAFERGAIDPIWSTNHEHPALMKSLFALSWTFLHQKFHLFKDASDAFRFPGMAMAGVALWVTYLWAARHFSRRAGVIAATLLALMVRIFYHAHLACFDIGIMAMWTWCLYVYWRTWQEKTVEWALLSGLAYGLTLETKHNAWILPFVFLVHTALIDGKRIARELGKGRLSIPTHLVTIAIIGPAVFVLCWPWLWNDTIPRVQEYAEFHLHHDYYNMEFLHQNYFGPPSPKLYAPVMILGTVPAVTLLLFAVGAVERLRMLAWPIWRWVKSRGEAAMKAVPWGDDAGTDVLLFLAFCAPIAPFFLPKTPIFGGTKHWIPAYPFLAMFAGRGFDLTLTAMRRAWNEAKLAQARLPLAEWALAATVVLAPLLETIHSHPVGLSAYTPLVGGAAGAADLGLNRQFWGFTTENVAPYLDKAAPRNATVFIHDTAWDSWNRMVDEKRVRPDLRAVGSPSEAQFSLVQHELHMAEVDDGIWMAYGERAPAYVYTHDGVPVVSVYKR